MAIYTIGSSSFRPHFGPNYKPGPGRPEPTHYFSSKFWPTTIYDSVYGGHISRVVNNIPPSQLADYGDPMYFPTDREHNVCFSRYILLKDTLFGYSTNWVKVYSGIWKNGSHEPDSETNVLYSASCFDTVSLDTTGGSIKNWMYTPNTTDNWYTGFFGLAIQDVQGASFYGNVAAMYDSVTLELTDTMELNKSSDPWGNVLDPSIHHGYVSWNFEMDESPRFIRNSTGFYIKTYSQGQVIPNQLLPDEVSNIPDVVDPGL